METINVGEKAIEIDEYGYLIKYSDWSEEVARAMASADNFTLTQRHWEIIRFIRQHYDRWRTEPSEYLLIKSLCDKLEQDKGKLGSWFEQLTQLGKQQTFRYAGLPLRSTLNVSGKRIALDYNGKLNDSSDWTEEVARAMAMADGIELTPEHWEVIHYIRGHYEEYKCAPAERELLKAMGKQLGQDSYKDIRRCVYELFPDGPGRQACRYAGIPTPMSTV